MTQKHTQHHNTMTAQIQSDLWITNQHDLIVADYRDRERRMHYEDDEFQSALDSGDIHPIQQLAILAAD